jgi:hypothetical protein
MAYLNFNKITPPAPDDPLVNEVTQLNDNWDQLDSKLQPYLVGGTISNVETGQEFFSGANFRYAVWDGAATIVPDDIDAGWSAWTNLPMASGRFVRSGFQPKWRNNSTYRMVELSGGVQFDSGAGTWTLGSSFLLNADSSGSPPLSMLPVGGKVICQAATGLTTGTSVVASARIVVENPGGTSSFVRISGQYMGGPGGGNFIMLEQVWWWY